MAEKLKTWSGQLKETTSSRPALNGYQKGRCFYRHRSICIAEIMSSHHPLRETLIGQTGSSRGERRTFLNDFHSRTWAALLHTWEPAEAATDLT